MKVELPDTSYLTNSPRENFGGVSISSAWASALRAHATAHTLARRDLWFAEEHHWVAPKLLGDKGIAELNRQAWALLNAQHDLSGVNMNVLGVQAELHRAALHLYIQAHDIAPPT